LRVAMLAVWLDATAAQQMADKMVALLGNLKDLMWAAMMAASMVDLTAFWMVWKMASTMVVVRAAL